jgi:hypothetical protein
MGIKSVYPFNRTSQLIVMDDGTRMMRINSTQNPLYYQAPSGVLLPVNVAQKAVTKVGVNDICLREASIASVGFKVTDDAYKYLGLRPDCVQDGSEQLEFSISSIEFDGKPQTINLSRNTAKSALLTEIGPLVYIQSSRQRTRQMVRVETPISSFRVVYQIDITGLNLVIKKDIDEFWFYSDRTGDFRFRIRKPYLVDVNGEPHAITEAVTHTLVVNKDGTLTYTKENTIDLSEVKAPYFIDADTVYSTTADGYVANGGGTYWPAIHDATSGSTAVSNGASYDSACHASGSTIAIYRSFFYFDISTYGFPLSGSICIYGKTNGASNVSIQQGTQSDTLAVADFDAFSGNYWAKTTSWSTSGYNTLALDATGLAALQSAAGGTFKVCAREYEHDYVDSAPGGFTYANGAYYAEQTSTTYDPYILATFGPSGIKTINGLSAAEIKTVNGLAYSSVKTFSGV